MNKTDQADLIQMFELFRKFDKSRPAGQYECHRLSLYEDCSGQLDTTDGTVLFAFYRFPEAIELMKEALNVPTVAKKKGLKAFLRQFRSLEGLKGVPHSLTLYSDFSGSVHKRGDIGIFDFKSIEDGIERMQDYIAMGNT